MNRDLAYRLLGYVVGGILLRYAILQIEIWTFWSESGYLARYFPAWWIALAAWMILMAVVLFMPAVVPQRYRGTPFTLVRAGTALFLLAFCWYWYRRNGGLFHDWVAHPYLGECSGAHSGDMFLAIVGTVAYALLPILGWQIARWKKWKQTCPPEIRRSIIIGVGKIAAISLGVAAVILTVTTLAMVRDPQEEQREKIKSTFRNRGACFEYTAPRRVRTIPVLGRALSDTLYNCKVMEFSGILAINDPVENEDLQALSGYRNLTTITIERSKVTDAGIEHLTKIPNLKWVGLTGCQVTDASIRNIIHIPHLETLFIEDTGITKKGAKLLRKALPGCSIFETKEPQERRRIQRAKSPIFRATSCQNNLAQIAKACAIYSMDHKDAFPSTFEVLTTSSPEYIANPATFICQMSGKVPGPVEEVDRWSDYVLVTNVTPLSDPRLVLAYCKPENHKGQGCYVLYVYGSVHWVAAKEFGTIPCDVVGHSRTNTPRQTESDSNHVKPPP